MRDYSTDKSLTRDGALKRIDCSSDRSRKTVERSYGGAGNSHIRVAEEYARGAFSIIIKFDRETSEVDPGNRTKR
jgi:hypothetical protein